MGDITWNDIRINRIVELCASHTMVFEVDYPGTGARWIVFRDVTGYRVEEGPFAGCPTILDMTEKPAKHGRKALTLETTAGQRMLECSSIELVPVGTRLKSPQNHRNTEED